MTEKIKFSDYLYYDEHSPSGLRWNVDVFYGRYKTTLKSSKNDMAGSLDVNGYWQVKLNGKVYKAHRIVFNLVYNKEISTLYQIDHINGIKTDNRICNLREVDSKTNARNRNMQSNNKTGVVGVSLINGVNYRAQYVNIDGKIMYKYFNILKLGKEEALRSAKLFRETMLHNLNSCGDSYTDRHINGGEKLAA